MIDNKTTNQGKNNNKTPGLHTQNPTDPTQLQAQTPHPTF